MFHMQKPARKFVTAGSLDGEAWVGIKVMVFQLENGILEVAELSVVCWSRDKSLVGERWRPFEVALEIAFTLFLSGFDLIALYSSLSVVVIFGRWPIVIVSSIGVSFVVPAVIVRVGVWHLTVLLLTASVSVEESLLACWHRILSDNYIDPNKKLSILTVK